MAKVVLLGDTHFGISDGKPLMHVFFEKVYRDWFFPLMVELGIKTVYQFGDMFDKRKGVDSFSASESKRYFFEPLEEAKLQLVALIGNHDAFFKESIEVNSPDLLLNDWRTEWNPVVDLVQAPRTVTIGGTTIDIIPWICRDNQEHITAFIEQSDSDYCFGHFEIEGFAMYKGVESQHGLSREMFKKYKKVYSGHYHTRSSDGNIEYIGTPCEMTWNDYDDPRGIHVFDTDTGETQFYPCPFTLFTKLVYDEDKVDKKVLPDIGNKYVKLIVENRTDFKKYDKYVTTLNEIGPHDIKIIEDLSDFNNDNVSIDVDKLDLDDTPTLLRNYVDGVETDLDKDRLKRELHLLYVEAKALET
jgi:DNA repair exonuclease SbcCD nuclease subunit